MGKSFLSNQFFMTTSLVGITLGVTSSVLAMDPTQELLYGLEMRNVSIMKEAIKQGADVNVKCEEEKGILHWLTAVKWNKYADYIAYWLLEYGADPDMLNDRSETPLICAARKGNYHLAWWLLFYGANPDVKDPWGDTALHEAVYEGRKDLAYLLLMYNANTEIKNIAGVTPRGAALTDEMSRCMRENIKRRRIYKREQEYAMRSGGSSYGSGQ